ncbi:ASCH domain-containing protein [Candidatus Poriferisodalis sp.]|uniref:ASCH domain-containing protein n=1 Tax=Candidatus Poriferisodalis sp. TaxID=3101277 RepID=UPI003B026269
MNVRDEAADKARSGLGHVLVLSLKPRYASAIVSGAKTIELRRTRPRIATPTLALIYSTRPVMSLVGTCRVDSIESQSLRDLWCLASSRAGISRREFHEYFSGLSEGIALHLSDAQRAETPVSLAQLRRLVDGFRPPQSFGYLSADDSGRILAAAP